MAILTETVTVPIWLAVLAAVAIVAGTVFVRRLEAKRQTAAVVGLAVVAAFALALPTLLQTTGNQPVQDGVAVNGDAVQRRALDSRRVELSARETMPELPLACLSALVGEPVASACERTVFASPTSVAAAVGYAAAQLQLLAEGAAYARRTEPGYAATGLTDLRLAAENDAYGIYAHVLATRDGCTPERCEAFALLRDPSTLKLHLRQRVYATYVAQHRERWGGPVTPRAVAPVAVVPHPSAEATAMAALAATTALAPQPVPPVVTAPPPLPKARPAPPVQIELATVTPAPLEKAATERPAIEKPAIEKPAIEKPALEQPAIDNPAAEKLANGSPPDQAITPAATIERRLRRTVPPVASVLPNLDFPSASSIPAISIIAAEPKLPPENTAPARPSTTPGSASSKQ